MYPRLVPIVALLATLPLILAQSCNTVVPGSDTGSQTDSTTLTEGEADAIEAAVTSSSSLAQAAVTSQNASSTGDDDSAQTLPDISGDITFGTCPVVSLSASSEGVLTFTVNIDFGTGCAFPGTDDYLCSGSAGGTVSQSDRSLELTFDQLSCNDEALNGSAGLVYERSGTDVLLTGDWNLTAVVGDDTAATDGTGTCGYGTSDFVTTISTFDGTVSDSIETWNLLIDNVLVSYPNTGSSIPYSGEATVSGNSIRTLAVRFGETSPSTGDVEISIAGSPFFTVNLWAL